MKIRSLLYVFCFFLLVEGCGETEKAPPPYHPPAEEGKGDPKEEEGINPESGKISSLKSVPGDSSKPSFETADKAESFKTRIKRINKDLLEADYTVDKMELMDRTPIFPKALNSFYLRHRRKNAISSRAFGNVIPRHVLKAWEFPSKADLEYAILKWLNDFEHSGDKLELGAPVDAFKSPPFLLGITENEAYLLSSACIFNGKEWDSLRENFMKAMADIDAKYRIEVTCQAGKWKYWK